MASTTITAAASDPRAVFRDIFSATLGSVCCCYVGQPFDTVKVRMQTNPERFSSVFPTVTSLVKNEGTAALWKGAVPTALGMAAENAMAFGVNEALKRTFPDEDVHLASSSAGPPGLVKPFVMGAITGCCSALVLLPSEVMKAKLQVNVGHAATSGDIWKRMLAEQGVRSLAIGLDAQLARDASFYAVFFGGYELFCYGFRTYAPWMPDELNFFLSGGFAGMFGWTVAMPLDVPKTNVRVLLLQFRFFRSRSVPFCSVLRVRLCVYYCTELRSSRLSRAVLSYV